MRNIDIVYCICDKAKNELNNKFDIREFHEKILEYGTVTLPILERRINNYIEKKK